MSADLAEFLLSPAAIRLQASKIYELAKAGQTHFILHEERLEELADYVLKVIYSNYPDTQVPYHSRWRHFEVGEQTSLRQYRKSIAALEPIEQAKCGIDLIIPSVLVDAGAGADWRYMAQDNSVTGRSEGLALASLDMFLSAELSHTQSMQTSAAGLQAITEEKFNSLFQVSADNPLVGVAGRVHLLNQLGEIILHRPDIFPNHRLGDLVDTIVNDHGYSPSAETILNLVLKLFGQIWPGRVSLSGVNLGDTWEYKPLGNAPENLVPFHKLSQWLSYSIIETLETSGFTIDGLDKLTGLAEYRNGGLILDAGLIALKDPRDAKNMWLPGDEIIIEWRALTIVMLDKIAARVQKSLGKDQAEFPLAKVLEGGTWSAGRKIAQEKRGDLSPPLNIASDATVF